VREQDVPLAAVPLVVDRVAVRHAGAEGSDDVALHGETERRELPEHERKDRFVGGAPDLVADVARDFEHERGAAGGGHRGAPVFGLLDPRDAIARIGHIHPGVLGDELAPEHQVDETQRAEPEGLRGIFDRLGKRGVELAQEVGQGDRRVKMPAGDRDRPAVRASAHRGDLRPRRFQAGDLRAEQDLAAQSLHFRREAVEQLSHAVTRIKVPACVGPERRAPEPHQSQCRVAQVQKTDPLRGPVGRDARRRDAPQLLGVRAEEAGVERAAEARDHPVFEGQVRRGVNEVSRFLAKVATECRHVLAKAERAQEVERVERVAEPPAVMEDHAATFTRQKVVSYELAHQPREVFARGHEPVPTEVEAVAVLLDGGAKAAAPRLALEDDDGMSPPRELPRAGKARWSAPQHRGARASVHGPPWGRAPVATAPRGA
jgi:hypothetical protein